VVLLCVLWYHFGWGIKVNYRDLLLNAFFYLTKQCGICDALGREVYRSLYAYVRGVVDDVTVRLNTVYVRE
jgi:hypothetical protein